MTSGSSQQDSARASEPYVKPAEFLGQSVVGDPVAIGVNVTAGPPGPLGTLVPLPMAMLVPVTTATTTTTSTTPTNNPRRWDGIRLLIQLPSSSQRVVQHSAPQAVPSPRLTSVVHLESALAVVPSE